MIQGTYSNGPQRRARVMIWIRRAITMRGTWVDHAMPQNVARFGGLNVFGGVRNANLAPLGYLFSQFSWNLLIIDEGSIFHKKVPSFFLTIRWSRLRAVIPPLEKSSKSPLRSSLRAVGKHAVQTS